MEVAWKGFGSACRYLSLLGAMGVPAFIINPMVRTMAIERGHVSPLELVHDRYRSHVLHLLLACTLVTALFLSCGAQLLALKSVLQTLTNDHGEAYLGSIFIAFIAVACELAGGFRGIARIDALTMAVLLGSCLVCLLVVGYGYGGFTGVGPEGCANGLPNGNEFQSATLFCTLNATDHRAGHATCQDDGCARTCLAMGPCDDGRGRRLAEMVDDGSWADASNCTVCTDWSESACPGCFGGAWIFGGVNNGSVVDNQALVRQPHVWQGDHQVWKTFALVVVGALGGVGGAMSPHVFQRVVAADSDLTLKNALLPTLPVCFFVLLVTMLCGITWMANHGPQFNFGDDGYVLSGVAGLRNPFAGMMDDLVDRGGIIQLVGLVTLCGAMASLLAAANMLAMGCGSILAVAVFRNQLWPLVRWGDSRGDWRPNKSFLPEVVTLDSQTVWLSKLIGMLVVFGALVAVALPEHADLFELFDWVAGLTAQASPALWFSSLNIFWLGRRVHAAALTLGLLAGIASTLYIHVVIMPSDEDVGADVVVPELIIPAPFWGVIVNWTFTIYFILALPQSLADPTMMSPKPSWLEWDSPSAEFLRKFGKEYLTFNKAEIICENHHIPSHRRSAQWAGLLAVALTVATLPWRDGGAPGPTGAYTPAAPTQDDYLFGLPSYVCIQIAGAILTVPIFVAVLATQWDAPDYAVSGRLGAVLQKRLTTMTVQDVTRWLLSLHHTENMAWGVTLDYYVDQFAKNEVDGQVLSDITKTRLGAYTPLETWGVTENEHAIMLVDAIHDLKENGWLVEDFVYSREWERKLKDFILERTGRPIIQKVDYVPQTTTKKDAAKKAEKDLFEMNDTGRETGFDEFQNPLDGDGAAGSSGRQSTASNSEAAADPVKHRSGMYLRWDPHATDRASMDGQGAWTNVLKKCAEYEGTGESIARVELMYDFEQLTQPWEHASNYVVPWRGEDINRRNLTHMLRGNSSKFIGKGHRVRSIVLHRKTQQGQLSESFLLRAKYQDESGAPQPGPKTMVAKFLPSRREFVKARHENGHVLGIFRTETFVYETNFCTRNGMQQPTCVFAAHDPERDSFCILLEDLYSLNLDSGEALSELNAVQEGLTPLPDLGLYSEQFRTLARFNGSLFNATKSTWTDDGGKERDLASVFLGFDSTAHAELFAQLYGEHWPGYRQLVTDLGFDSGDDSCFPATLAAAHEWLSESGGHAALFEASKCVEDGGWLDCGIAHGDMRVDNAFYARPGAQVEGARVRIIDFQHVKRASPAFDCALFLSHSVPTAWRREHELPLLSVYYDALVATPGFKKWSAADPSNTFTWEVFLMHVQFCLFYCLYYSVSFASEQVVCYERIDKARYTRGAAHIRRLQEMWSDWEVSSAVVIAAQKRVKDGMPRAQWQGQAAELLPANLLEGYCEPGSRDRATEANPWETIGESADDL